MPKQELDETLADFYLEIRNKNGDMYKKITLVAYRHGIQRYLVSHRPNDNTDIVRGSEFKKVAKSFQINDKGIEKAGKAQI
ncbi:hypothetical protein KUTeg_021773 [Tegillarca granosa]|uniref:Uncharacterized protein n=1 Tax=Tegillarca granosa TaxID=220873 RepID=A0ABQ9E7E6_TEGGR|nr:hypothetical protein KUTeg_021773 [Tegillarca granosa]